MRTLPLALAVAGAIAAQPAPHTTTLPRVATGTFFGSASSFPLGRTGGKAQYWFRNDSVRPTFVVNSIGPRPVRNASGTGRTQSIEITMSNTTLTHSGFTGNFAQNLGPQATIVHARRNVVLPSLSTHVDPDLPIVWMALDAPFVVSGPNLLIDWDLGSAVGAASAPYNGDLRTLSGSGVHLTSETSCGGALTATSTATTYTLSLTGAGPSQPAFLMLSLDSTYWGTTPLPFRLDLIGMTGCVLGVDPQIVINTMTDAAGAAQLNVPITLPIDNVIYAQAAHPVTTTPLGLGTTNVTRSILGATGFCRYIYNFTVDGPTAQNGPNEWQGVMLFRP